MKTSTRRWLGGVLLASAFITAVVLYLSDTSLMSVEHATTQTDSNGRMKWANGIIRFHWSLDVLSAIVAAAAAALGGFILVLIPGPQKPND